MRSFITYKLFYCGVNLTGMIMTNLRYYIYNKRKVFHAYLR